MILNGDEFFEDYETDEFGDESDEYFMYIEYWYRDDFD